MPGNRLKTLRGILFPGSPPLCGRPPAGNILHMPGNKPADSEDTLNKVPDHKKGHTSYPASFIKGLKKHLQIDIGLNFVEVFVEKHDEP